MNDFLQSLRGGNLKTPRPGITRKAQDHMYHSYNQRYQYYSSTQANGNARPQETPLEPAEHPGQESTPLLESIEKLSEHVKQLAENQIHLVTTQERAAYVLERQALAIERIMTYIMDATPQTDRDMC